MKCRGMWGLGWALRSQRCPAGGREILDFQSQLTRVKREVQEECVSKTEIIIHGDRPACWEVQHKRTVKRIPGALAAPTPRIHGYPDANGQHCLCFQVRETPPLCFLLRRLNGDFCNRNHVRFFTCHVNVNNSVQLSEPWSSHP